MLVTGGSGYLGRHLRPLAQASGWQVVAPVSTEVDVRDAYSVAQFTTALVPSVVVHLAYRPDDEQTIVDGSLNVARAAAAVGARLVHMSTDVVFHGRHEPYREDDPPDPLSDYGRMKAAAETAVLERDPTAVCVRTSLMYGTSVLGACQHDVLRAVEDPDAMVFFTDEIRCFTAVEDVASALVTLAAHPKIRGPLHVVAPQPLSRHEFALTMAAWLGHPTGAIRSTTLSASGLRRPARVALDSSRAAAMGIRCRPVDEVVRSAFGRDACADASSPPAR